MNSDDEWNLSDAADEEWNVDEVGDNEVNEEHSVEEHENEQDGEDDEEQDQEREDDEEQDQEHADEEQEIAEASESDGDELDDGDPHYVETSPVTRDHFDFLKRLGTGAYGTVFLVRKNCGIDKGKIYAIKVIAKDVVVEARKTIIHMRAERKVLELLRGCPYIPNLYYAFQTQDKLFIVLDYIPGGEMFTLLQKNVLDENRVRFYVAELVVALEHIHKHDIVYRDIKLENILIDADGHVKLVDFGLCKKLGIKRRTKSFCGTVEYMAPEVVNGIGHDTSADWWALGVLTIELLTGITAFGASDPNQQNEIMERILNDTPAMPQNISSEMEDFILKMLNKDPITRLGGNREVATDIKNHPLFNGMDWNKLEKKELPAPEVPNITGPCDVQNFSEEFTSQPADYEPSGIPKDTFLIFKGYSYIAPEFERVESNDLECIDASLKALSLDVFNNRKSESKFFQKYNFISANPIGYGTTSVCMKCKSLTNNNIYAVKVYNRREKCTTQIDVLEKCAAKKVKGIVQLIEVITDAKWTYLVMEFIDGVNLLEHLNIVSFNGKYVCDIFVALCKIVKKVHSVKYSHGRVCFKNIRCIKNSADICLIGFSYSQPIKGIIDEHVDLWSIGVCLYTLLCGHSPFQILPSNVLKTASIIHGNIFNKDSITWTHLHKDTSSLIDKLLRNTITNLYPRIMKSIVNETFITPLHNAKQLIDENQKIISIRNIKNKATSEDDDVILENGNNSNEYPDVSNAPSILQSQQINSTQQKSQNGKNESYSPMENIRKRPERSTPLTDIIDLSATPPFAESKRINNVNAFKRRSKSPKFTGNEIEKSVEPPPTKSEIPDSVNASKRHTKSPKLTDEHSAQKTSDQKIQNGESGGQIQLENKRKTRRKSKRGDTAGTTSPPIKVENDSQSSLPDRYTSSKRDTDQIKTETSFQNPILTEVKVQDEENFEPVRKSPRIAQAKKLVQNTGTPKTSIKLTKQQTKNVPLSKKPTSHITHVTYATTANGCIDQRMQNLGLGVREHKQFVYNWPMRKIAKPYYTFERFDYK